MGEASACPKGNACVLLEVFRLQQSVYFFGVHFYRQAITNHLEWLRCVEGVKIECDACVYQEPLDARDGVHGIGLDPVVLVAGERGLPGVQLGHPPG